MKKGEVQAGATVRLARLGVSDCVRRGGDCFLSFLRPMTMEKVYERDVFAAATVIVFSSFLQARVR